MTTTAMTIAGQEACFGDLGQAVYFIFLHLLSFLGVGNWGVDVVVVGK